MKALPSGWRERAVLLCVLLGVLTAGLGGKFLLVRSVATGVPYWDEWDGDGIRILAPFEWGKLDWRTFFALHNEHRPALTRATDFALYRLNDRMWDTRVEMVANAFIHAAALLVLLLAVQGHVRRGDLAFAGVMAAALLALPFAWENTLIGFQSQFYFLLLTAVLHLWLSWNYPPFRAGWWIGQLVGVLGLFSMSSGAVSGAALATTGLIRALARGRKDRSAIPNLVAGVLLTVAGVALIRQMPHHAGQYARSVTELVRAMGLMLAWPFPPAWLGWTWVHLPAAVFLVRLVRGRRESQAVDWFLGGCTIWYWLQIGTLAAFRSPGVNAEHASRYLDIHGAGLLLSAICFMRLLAVTRSKAVLPLAAAWSVLLLAGLAAVSRTAWRDRILPFRDNLAAQEARLARFFHTRDADLILHAPENEVPYPHNPAWLLHLLTIPVLAEAMPPGVRAPLPMAPAAATGFVSTGCPPELGPSTHAQAWGNWNQAAGQPARWQSPPIRSRFPLLRLRAAAADTTAIRLGVEFVATPGPQFISPEQIGSGRWKTAHLFLRGREARLCAESPDSRSWLAFTDVVEVGKLSWLAGKALRLAESLLAVGGGLLLMGALLRPGRAPDGVDGARRAAGSSCADRPDPD